MNSLRGIPFYISYDYGDDVEHYDYSNLGNPTTYTIDTDDFTLKAPTKTGYTFIGWTGSNGNTPQTTVTIVKGSTGDRNYVAHWEVTSYSITYNLNGGTADNPTTYTIESETIILTNPTKTGYTFIGWTGSNGNIPQTTVTITGTGDKSYTANWSSNAYSITYNLNGGIADNPTTYTVDEPLTLTNPTKTGYTFTGWTGSNGSIPQTTVTITGTGDKSYTANWSIINYKIDYA